MAQFVSPFANRSLSAWIESLQQATSADERYRALLAINAIGQAADAVTWCRHALRDQDSAVRALAAKQLGDLKRRHPAGILPGAEVGTELSSRLVDEDPDVRFEAARSLGQISPQFVAAREVLLNLLDDEGTQPLMIAAVVSALGERTDLDVPAMISRFRSLLGHAQAEVRENTSSAVSKFSAIAAGLTAELIIALDDEEPLVRENAAIALGNSGASSSEVLSSLATATRDEDEGVAAAAQAAQAKLS